MSNNTTLGQSRDKPALSRHDFERYLFSLIASLSIVGNIIVCLVICRARVLLKKAHNVLIMNLAVTDAVQGILLFATPEYVFLPQSYPQLSGTGGDVFCRVIFSTYLLFVCGKASNGSIMCLAIERWCAVVIPTTYKSKFSRRRLNMYICLIWLSAAVTEVYEMFIAEHVDGSCRWISPPPYGTTAENAFVVLHVTVTFYIPCVVTWGSFAHIWLRMSHNTIQPHGGCTNVKRSVVRMCALAAFFLTVCWFPTETFWVLKKFNLVVLSRTYYIVFNLLAFFSLCVNPFVYCFSNKDYRHEVLKVLIKVKCCPDSPRAIPRDVRAPFVLNNLQLRSNPSNSIRPMLCE